MYHFIMYGTEGIEGYKVVASDGLPQVQILYPIPIISN